MSVARTVAEILAEHVTLEIEGIDRLYLNVYVPRLQHVGGVVGCFRAHRGQPITVDGQRAAALRFEQERVQALLSALVLFSLLPAGFSNRDLREHLAPLPGLAPSQLPPGRMTYDLRRLRLHGLIERLPHTHRYRLTRDGLHAALFFTRSYARLFRSGLAQIIPVDAPPHSKLRAAFDHRDLAIEHHCSFNRLVA